MTKRNILIALLFIVLSVSVSCKKKNEAMPDKEVSSQIVIYAPLPSFKEVYRALDQVKVKDISAAVPSTLYKAKQEEIRNAFSLGLLTADAVLAAKGRNKAKLGEISSQMMTLTALLGLEAEVNRMGDDMKLMIEKEQWEELDKALDFHKDEVENKLWESENYDNYTLMLMGGWIEAANRVAWLLSQNYDAKATEVLAQKGTFNSLIANLEQIKTPHIAGQDAFKEGLMLVKDIKTVLDSDKDRTYSKEQLGEIIALTEKIKATFQN